MHAACGQKNEVREFPNPKMLPRIRRLPVCGVGNLCRIRRKVWRQVAVSGVPPDRSKQQAADAVGEESGDPCQHCHGRETEDGPGPRGCFTSDDHQC